VAQAKLPLKVFLFGGAEGVAADASRTLNAKPSGLYCVGTFYPGHGSVDGMSSDEIIDRINPSDAD
jgi:N-acetylglucosaminyldiphosphoundecaprenol N-acetyl-beta-D-mannosaminyltransferase